MTIFAPDQQDKLKNIEQINWVMKTSQVKKEKKMLNYFFLVEFLRKKFKWILKKHKNLQKKERIIGSTILMGVINGTFLTVKVALLQ